MDAETEAPSAGGARQLLQSLARSTPSRWPIKPMEVKRWARYATGMWKAVGSREKSRLQQMHAVPKSGHCGLRPLSQAIAVEAFGAVCTSESHHSLSEI